MENSAPSENSIIATTNAQKKRSRPYPNGWSRSASLRAFLPPNSNNNWLPVSATECTASASIAPEPVNANPMNLITAMPRLAENAANTAFAPCPASLTVDDRRTSLSSALGDECGEQSLLDWIVVRRCLRMQLHGHHPPIGQLEALDHAVA